MNIQAGGTEARYRAMWREILKDRAIKACGGKCVICQGVYPNELFHFHHFSPTEKETQIFDRNINSAKTWNTIRDELTKTVLVCPNCHGLIHHGYVANPTKTSFNMEYYIWDLAEKAQNPRSILPNMVEKIRAQRPSELQTIHLDFNLEEVNIRFDKGNLIT